MPLERAIGNGVDRDLRLLSDRHVRDVRFVDLDFGLNHRHVGDGQQHGAGVVHRADDRRFAFLDVPARDDAGDRRFDAHFAEIELRARQLRAILSEPHFLRAHLLFALDERRLREPDVVLGALEHFARRQLLLPQLLLALADSAARRSAARGRSRPPGAPARAPTLAGLQRRLAALDARAQRARIDLHEELAERRRDRLR